MLKKGGKQFLFILLGAFILFSSFSGGMEAMAAMDAAEDTHVAGTPYMTDGEYNVEVPHVIINQVYGGGMKTATDTYVSHGFIELYNPTSADVELSGWSLQYADAPKTGVSSPWIKLDLTGTIKAKSSYLVIGAATGAASPIIDLSDTYDQVLVDEDNEPVFINNKGLKAVLLSNANELTIPQPFTPMAEGYVDMLGTAGNDDGNLIDGYETLYPVGKGANSKKIGLRRVQFIDTDNNKADFEAVDYSAVSLYGKEPRYSGDGAWGDELGITTESLPGGIMGSGYSTMITATGGASPYTFTASGLPDGLTIDEQSGKISGVPAQAGRAEISIIVTDSQARTESRTFILSIQKASIENTLSVTKISEYRVGTSHKDGGVAEIVKYNKDNGKMYIVNGASHPPSLDIVALTNEAVLTKDKSISVKALAETDGFSYGDLTSVDINTARKRVAVAVQEQNPLKKGKILELDYDGNLLATYEAGVQPDMVLYTKDGRYILTADEGEPRTAAGDPEGSVTIVDTVTGESVQVKFDDPTVIDDLVHIRGASDPATGQIWDHGSKERAITDFEPEYIALSADESLAYVALQENNAIATIDIAARKVLSVRGLGFKDYNDPKNALDLVKDGIIDLENVPFYGIYMPDGIASYSVNGQLYLLTANEGDATEWPEDDPHRINMTTIGELKDKLVPGSDIVQFLSTTNRYDKVEVVSDMSKDGIYMLGGRSFSIWNADTMELVFDSGSDFETITAQRLPEYFNASNSKEVMDDRSAKKGPEPEYVTVGQVGDRTYAFVGLERIGGVMTYDVTNPENPVFANYINTRDFTKGLETDTGPEGLEFIPAKFSPTGYPLLLVANEVGGTVAVLQLNVEPVPDTDWSLTIMHTNDTHAHLADVARRATLVKQIRSEGGNSLLVDAGDVFSGDLYFTKWAGLADVQFMNLMGYDAMTFGNHEFDSGTSVLADFIQAARFPLLTSNIDFRADEYMSPLLKSAATIDSSAEHTADISGVYPYVIFEVNGERVGMFGLTTEDTVETSSPGKSVRFADATAAAKATVAAIEAEGVHVIIALSHLGYNRDKELAQAVQGIDIVVGGHTHTKLDEPEVIAEEDGEPTVIVQAHERGNFLGRVDVVFDSEGVVQTDKLSGSLIAVDSSVEEDTEALALLVPYNAELDELKQLVVGITTVVLNGERSEVRARETNLGNFIADSMLYKGKQLKQADIALMNGGGIRASIDLGEITMGELRTVMPFGNTLMVLDVTGQQLKDGLENGISGAKLEDLPGKFPQVAGMRFKWDPNQPVGGKVYDIEIKTEAGYAALDLNENYRLATNSFVAFGGDGYTSFAEAIDNGAYHEDLGYPDYEMFMEYMDSLGGTIAPVIEGRIVEQARSAGGNPGNGGSGSGVFYGEDTKTEDSVGQEQEQEPGQGQATAAKGIIDSDDLEIKREIGEDGSPIYQATVEAGQLKNAIAEAGAAAGTDSNQPLHVRVDLSELQGVVEVTLPIGALGSELTDGPPLTIEVVTAAGSYILPMDVLDGFADELTDDAGIRVVIAPVGEERLQRVTNSAAAPGVRWVDGLALLFEVYVLDGAEEWALNDYGTTYVSRMMHLPDSITLSHVSVVAVDPVSGELRFVPQLVKTVGGRQMIEIKSASHGLYALIEYQRQFADVRGHWAAANIESVASRLIVQGINDTDFAPDRPITRAEFTAILVRGLGLVPGDRAQSFRDVSRDAWYSDEVGAAASWGLVQGREPGLFAPDAGISRAEMIVMIARAIGIISPSAVENQDKAILFKSFQDANHIPQWAAAQAALLAELDILNGYQDGTIAPSAQATRAEVAVMLQRALIRLGLLN